jgi:endoglucanase
MARWMAFLGLCAGLSFASNPVETHGWLSVKGNRVVDQTGEPAKLRGMSFFWSQWMGKYWNDKVVDWLVKDWEVSVVRAAMAVDNGGYLTTPAVQEGRVRTVVESAIQHGTYVIIDWHEENAVDHQAQSIEFFQKIARDYGKYPNVIYEIYNEPTTQQWWQIKNYANEVVKAIRAIDPKNLIIVGDPSWSAEVDKPAGDPVMGANVAYTLHFYAASHKQWLRDRADAAMNSGIALFVTEWGTCESSGDGVLDYNESKTWLNWMDDRGISWTNWAISDKAETCAALDGAGTSGGWSSSDLSASGAFVRDELRQRNNYTIDPVVLDTFAVPGLVDASKPVATLGAKLEDDTQGGGRHLAYIDDGTSASWTIKATSGGILESSVLAASENAGGSIRWLLDGKEVGKSLVTGTSGWQTWTKQAGPAFMVSTGVHHLKLEFSGTGTGLFNLDGIEFSRQTVGLDRRLTGQKTWTIEGQRLDVRGQESETVSLRDAFGRILSQAKVESGVARLELPAKNGLLFLVSSTGLSQAVLIPSMHVR